MVASMLLTSTWSRTLSPVVIIIIKSTVARVGV